MDVICFTEVNGNTFQVWECGPLNPKGTGSKELPASQQAQLFRTEDTNMGGGGFCGFVFFPTTLKLYENWNLVVGLMHYGCGGCIKL